MLDESGSMGSVVNQLKAFAQAIIDQFVIGDNSTRVSITFFDNSASLLRPLTADSALLDAAIGTFSPGGGTCISCGLTTGAATIDASNGRPGVPRAMLMLTDGRTRQRQI